MRRYLFIIFRDEIKVFNINGWFSFSISICEKVRSRVIVIFKWWKNYYLLSFSLLLYGWWCVV